MLKILRNLKFRDSFLFLFLIAVGAIVCYATVLIADYTTNLMASLNNYQTFKTLFNSGLIDDKFVGVYNGQTAWNGNYATTQAWINGGILIAISFATAMGNCLCGVVGALISTKLSRNIRLNFFKKVNAMSFSDINAFSISSLITRSTNDVTQIQTLFGQLQLVVIGVGNAIAAVAKISSIIIELSYVTMSTIGALIVVIIVICFFVIPRFKRIQTLTDDLNLSFREQLVGLRVIRAFNAHQFQTKKFDKTNNSIFKTNLVVTGILGFAMPLILLFINITTLGIYFVASILLKNGVMLPTDFQYVPAFASLSVQVIFSVLMAVMFLLSLPRALISANRINEIIYYKPSIVDPLIEQSFPKNKKGEITFDHVSFKYSKTAKEYVISDVSFTAKNGEFVAIIGSTGSGKSSLINLIPRFYEVTDGRILINGVDIKKIKQNTLHDKIGYVPQKSVLLSGTIEENIKYGKTGQINDDSMIEASDIACASEFINKDPDHYLSNVSQAGNNFSGGQKQRISIARAISRKPEILIFDDSFSALDYRTDSLVRKNIRAKLKDTTCIVVAQRIGTIINADKIIVLDQGKMVGSGTHKSLLKNCKIYQEIALSQLSKKELGYEN